MSLIKINPDVLRWAREESSYSPSELADKLSVDKNQYQQWETTGIDIPFPILKDISKKTKRQIAVFFLPEAPKKLKKPSDFRNLVVSRQKLSFDSLLAFRRVAKFRELLTQLNGGQFYQDKYNWLTDFEAIVGNGSLINHRIFTLLRDTLDYSLEQQIQEKTIPDTYNKWRNYFEDRLGIYIFQFSMPPSEIQGFSYSDGYPYCIAINGKYPVTSRIFTLFHELGHIIKRQSGLCIPDKVTEDQTLEFECNSFAGAFLVPDNVVKVTSDKDEIFKRATRLKISSEVYLRRLKTLDLVSDDEFFSLLQEIRSSVKTKGFGILTPIQKSLNSRGQTLFNSVLNALNTNKISYERASDILGLKISHIINE